MNLLLISDDKINAKQIAKKLVFLRKDDSVVFSSYEEAARNIKISNPAVVLVHEHMSKQRTVDLINGLHNMHVSVILLADSYDSELILSCADVGADDFILSNADAFEFVIRIVNNIKHNSMKYLARRNNQLLEQVKVIDESTGIYKYEYSKQVIENAIDNDLITSGVLMAISPSANSKISINLWELADKIKSSTRIEDISTHGRGMNFYIFMPNTDLNGALTVLNKINENFKYEIIAGISEISDKSFNEIEKQALKALSEATATNSQYIFAQNLKEQTFDELYENSDVKNYKLFKQLFNKKLKNVITPVFYRLQQTYEEKLFETEIIQYTNDDHCVFRLKNKNKESALNIIYPGFSKIIIDITHSGLDSPENREIQLQLSNVNQKDLTEIIENFIEEYKKI